MQILLSGFMHQHTIVAEMNAHIDPSEIYCVDRAREAKTNRGIPTWKAKYLNDVSEMASRIPALVATPLPPLKPENSG